jgi:hypothetical protein
MTRHFFRSPLFLFLVLPILVSVLIHAGLLIYAAFTQWRFGYVGQTQGPQSILIDIKKKEPAPRAVGDPHMEKKVPPKVRPSPIPVSAKPDAGGEGKKKTVGIIAGAEGADWLKVDPSWGTAKKSGMLHAGPQGPTQTFAEYIQTLRGSGLDVVIVFDSTESMAIQINEIKLKIGNLALALRKLVPSCRIGLVSYRDKSDQYVTISLPLTYGVSSLQRFLNGAVAEGGGDPRESVLDGLKVAIEEMNWNRKSKPFILLIGDAPPHKPDIPRCIEKIKTFRNQKGGTVSVLDVRRPLSIASRKDWEQQYRPYSLDPELETYGYLTDRESVDDTFQRFAEAGGGESARLINEEKLIRHMLIYIFGTQWEAYFTEVMKNL